MSIDQDDLFINDIFNKCYKEMDNLQIDIIEFSGFLLRNQFIDSNKIFIPKYLKNKKNNLIIKQPQLSHFIYQKRKSNYKLIDAYIWGKCIKTIIYKKALHLIGKKIFALNVCWSEDRVVNFALFQVAFSFKFIKIYGIIHYLHRYSVGHIWKKKKINKICHDELVNIHSIYNLIKNTKYIDIVVYELKKKFSYISKGLTKLNKIYFIFLFNKIINSKYLTIKKKKQLPFYLKTISKINLFLLQI